VVDNCGNLETYSTIDKDIADLNGNTAEFRLSEDLAFIEGMNQQMAGVLFYGNTAVNPERFMGFAPRYNSVATATAATAANVIDAGGVGAVNTSIWVVVWGPNTMAGFFPKGKISGLQHRDLGEWTVYDANNNPYQAYRTHFKWELGLTVRDWRYAVRIANVDVNNLQTGRRGEPDQRAHPRDAPPADRTDRRELGAVVRRPDEGAMSSGQTVIYCNRIIRTYLDIQATNKTNVLLRMEQWHGETITTFKGVPIRTCDQILNTEAAWSNAALHLNGTRK
jgi:hypothetical protein